MILTRGLGHGGPLVTAGLGLGATVVPEPARRPRRGGGHRWLKEQNWLDEQRRAQILAEDRLLNDLIIALVTHEVLH